MDLPFPLELLQKIFLLLVDLYPREPSHLSRRPGWITITYVCRYWREAALGLRELWTHITPSLSISWSQVMMERSAPLLVHIDRHICDYLKDRVESELLATSRLLSASRIRALRLSGHPTYVLKVLNCLCSPSPLESLSLRITHSAEPVDIPETFCARDTPNFRRLTFENFICIRAPLWLLAGVTHFTTSANVSIPELINTLRAMPQLEELCVTHDCYHDKPRYLPVAEVALPRLSLLTVHSDSPQVFIVLSAHIVDAPSTTLRRRLFWREFCLQPLEPGIFTCALDLVPRDSAPGIDDGGLRAAQVTGGPECGSFEVWSRTTRTRSPRAARSAALFLFRLDWKPMLIRDLVRALDQADGPPSEHCPFFHLASLCAHLQTTCIEDLTVAPSSAPLTALEEEREYVVDIVRPEVVAQWRALLVALPAVKILRLHRRSPARASILRALAASPGLLPHLRKVFVVQSTVRCAGGLADTDADSAMASREPVLVNIGAELVEAVSVRSGLEVVLVGCEVDEEALEALRKRARVDFGKEWEYMQSESLE